MNKSTTSTRRNFLRGGALLAAPVAAASLSAAVLADEGPRHRLADLEDQAAIRELHAGWLRQINGGAASALLAPCVRRILADHQGSPDKIEVDADRQTAVGYFDHAVEFAMPLPEDSTLAQMARVQGHGVLRYTERRMLKVDYARSAAGWEIRRVRLSAA